MNKTVAVNHPSAEPASDRKSLIRTALSRRDMLKALGLSTTAFFLPQFKADAALYI